MKYCEKSPYCMNFRQRHKKGNEFGRVIDFEEPAAYIRRLLARYIEMAPERGCGLSRSLSYSYAG